MPATPYQRLLASGQLSQAARQSLEQRYASLNPIQLRQQIEHRQNELLRTIRGRETSPDSSRKLTSRSVTSFRDPTGGCSVTGGNDLTRVGESNAHSASLSTACWGNWRREAIKLPAIFLRYRQK